MSNPDHPAAPSLDDLLIDARHTAESHRAALASAERDGHFEPVRALEDYAINLLRRLGAHAPR